MSEVFPVNVVYMSWAQPGQGLLGATAFGPGTAAGAGDTTPCRMTGVTLHSHVRYKEV